MKNVSFQQQLCNHKTSTSMLFVREMTNEEVSTEQAVHPLHCFRESIPSMEHLFEFWRATKYTKARVKPGQSF